VIDVVVLHALFGTSLPISKYLLQFSPPFFLAGIRMFVAGLLLLVFNYFRKKQFSDINRSHIFDYVQVIVIGIYLKYMLRYWALDFLTASKMSFLFNSGPFIAALFSYFAFNERLTIKQWAGLFIGFVGFIPILITSSTAEQSFGEFMYISWPELAVFLAVMAHCYGMIVSRKIIRKHGHSASLANGVRMFGGGLLALITSYFVEQSEAVTHIGTFIGWLGLLILISNIICHNFYLKLLKRYTVTFLSFADFLSPLFVAFYGWLFLHEAITWHYFASAAIVFSGLYLFYQDELKNVHISAH